MIRPLLSSLGCALSLLVTSPVFAGEAAPAAPSPAPAAAAADDEPERLRAAAELTELLVHDIPDQEGIRKLIVKTFDGFIAGKKPNAEGIAKIRLCQEWSIEQVTPERLKEISHHCFADHLTLSEIRSTVEFYRSPAGQAFLKQSPSMNAERDELARKLASEISLQAARKFVGPGSQEKK